jgi:hypothetical protein
MKTHKDVAEYSNFFNVGWKSIEDITLEIKMFIDLNNLESSIIDQLEIKSLQKEITRYP